MAPISSAAQAHLSRLITVLRFPLLAFVVFIHSEVPEGWRVPREEVTFATSTLYEVFREIMAAHVGAIAVPLYFFLSGYLFFLSKDHLPFTLAVYRRKLRSRVRSLLLPYLFWNTLLLLLFWGLEVVAPNAGNPLARPFSTYAWYDFLACYWDVQLADPLRFAGFPICLQMWFVRDLMVMAVLSPLLYVVLRHGKFLFPLLLAVLFVSEWGTGWIGLDTRCWCFFSAGAYCAIHGKDFYVPLRSVFPLLCVLFIGLTVGSLTYGDAFPHWLGNSAVIVGAAALVGGVGRWLESHRITVRPLFLASGFFVYAYHGIAISFFRKLSARFLPLTGEVEMTLYSICQGVAVIALGVLLFALLRKASPRFAAFITGGRG